MSLVPPEIQAADALERFRVWWQRERLDDLVATFGGTLNGEQTKAMAEMAYLQGQIDGGQRSLTAVGRALNLDQCQCCGVVLPPSPALTDPSIPAPGRFCRFCPDVSAAARELRE